MTRSLSLTLAAIMRGVQPLSSWEGVVRGVRGVDGAHVDGGEGTYLVVRVKAFLVSEKGDNVVAVG